MVGEGVHRLRHPFFVTKEAGRGASNDSLIVFLRGISSELFADSNTSHIDLQGKMSDNSLGTKGDNKHHHHHHHRQQHIRTDKIKYESTHDGDVKTVLVQPSSFDNAENIQTQNSDSHSQSSPEEVQDETPRSHHHTDRSRKGHHHERHLSAHFLDATKLSPTTTNNNGGENPHQQRPPEKNRHHVKEENIADEESYPSNRSLVDTLRAEQYNEKRVTSRRDNEIRPREQTRAKENQDSDVDSPSLRARSRESEEGDFIAGSYDRDEMRSDNSSSIEFDGSERRRSSSDFGISSSREPSPFPPMDHSSSSRGNGSPQPPDDSSLTEEPTQQGITGQKHRRVFSGGATNPVVAHRRINSGGNAALIERELSFSYGGLNHPTRSRSQNRHHQFGHDEAPRYVNTSHHRTNSAGLDMLSAAADVSNDVLAQAAGGPDDRGYHHHHYQRHHDSFSSRGSASSKEEYGTQSQSFTRTGHSTASYYADNWTTNNRSRAMKPPPLPQAPISLHGGSYEHTMDSRSQHQQAHHYDQPRYRTADHSQYAPPPFYPQQHHRTTTPNSYPFQYSQSNYQRRSSDHHHHPPSLRQNHSRHHSRSSVSSAGSERIETEEALFTNRDTMPPPEASPPQVWSNTRGGTTTGVQTFVTAISVGEGNKTLRAAPTYRHASTTTSIDQAPFEGSPPSSVPSAIENRGHHRKMSSFSSIGTLAAGPNLFQDMDSAGGTYSQRARSSSTSSAIRSVDSGMVPGFETNDSFFRQLGPSASPETKKHHHRAEQDEQKQRYRGSKSMPELPASFGSSGRPPLSGRSSSDAERTSMHSASASASGERNVADTHADSSSSSAVPRRYMSSGTSKRIRRKCTVANCPNRVVQGGLCISHGAKRKTCSHPGCTKNVKKAGLCSAHGPARKRCEAVGCSKVAVQGGRCISHGAKKKLCSVENCTKQAILAGMCKKHHDQHNGIIPARANKQKSASHATTPSGLPPLCVVVGEEDRPDGAAPKSSAGIISPNSKPGHHRGLSIFQDMNAVNTIIGAGGSSTTTTEGASHSSTTTGDRTATTATTTTTTSEERGEGARGDNGTPRATPQEIRQASSPDKKKNTNRHQRGLSFFTDENVAATIIRNPDIMRGGN